MSITEEVRRHFEGFGPPCAPEDIARAEQELGHPLPAVLRELYLSFDGFPGPTGAGFFSPLLPGDDPNSVSLVGFTLSLRGEDYFPRFLQRAVVFGGDGCGSNWGILIESPDEIFEWHPEDGEEYSVVGGSPLDAWLRGKALYAETET
jgi:SMI1 / KNR4 family (SUKH-1)